MLIIVIIYTISIALVTIAFWGGTESSGLPFYDKMYYPTFVVRILLDNIIYPKSNHIGPLDFKWLLTGPLQSREIVKLHLKGSTQQQRTYILMSFFYLKLFENYLSDLNNLRCIRMLKYSAFKCIQDYLNLASSFWIIWDKRTTLICRFVVVARSPSFGR